MTDKIIDVFAETQKGEYPANMVLDRDVAIETLQGLRFPFGALHPLQAHIRKATGCADFDLFEAAGEVLRDLE